MLINVEHWSGAGNRFVIVDNRQKIIDHLWKILAKNLCQRPNLPDAEGLLVLLELNQWNSSCSYDFYNPDGSTGFMCGNGARCAVRSIGEHLLTNEINLTLNNCSYETKILDDDRVSLRLPLYKDLRLIDWWTYVNLHTHHVVLHARHFLCSIDEFHQFDLRKFANENLDFYRMKLAIAHLNLNIAYLSDDRSLIYLRTYENGVYNETQACGTGAVATAVAFWTRNIIRDTTIDLMPISQRSLTVHLQLDHQQDKIVEIILQGDAKRDATSTHFDTISGKYQQNTD